MKTLIPVQNSQPKIFTRIFLGIICLVIFSTIVLGQAVALAQPLTSLGQSSTRIFVAGDIEYTSVYLDTPKKKAIAYLNSDRFKAN
jgi:hypothetical protein